VKNAERQPPFPEYYSSTPALGGWDLHCKHPGCAVGFHVLPSWALRPGNALQLLNHTRSHKAKKASGGGK
jgi:hypothetical protein